MIKTTNYNSNPMSNLLTSSLYIINHIMVKGKTYMIYDIFVLCFVFVLIFRIRTKTKRTTFSVLYVNTREKLNLIILHVIESGDWR